MLFFRNLVALSATSVEVHWHDCRERRLKERLKDRTLLRLKGRLNHRLEDRTLRRSEERLKDQTLRRVEGRLNHRL